MKGKLIWSVFWALVGIFVVIVCLFLIPVFRGSIFLWFITVSGATFFLLGVALIFLTVKGKVRGMLKKFLLLTGASATGIFVFVLLHNAIYALFVHFFGTEFWNGGDEPFFFIMAIFVCPIGFLVGAVGSIVLRHKEA